MGKEVHSDELCALCDEGALNRRPTQPLPPRCPACHATQVKDSHGIYQRWCHALIHRKKGLAGWWFWICRNCRKYYLPAQPGPPPELVARIEARRAVDRAIAQQEARTKIQDNLAMCHTNLACERGILDRHRKRLTENRKKLQRSGSKRKLQLEKTVADIRTKIGKKKKVIAEIEGRIADLNADLHGTGEGLGDASEGEDEGIDTEVEGAASHRSSHSIAGGFDEEDVRDAIRLSLNDITAGAATNDDEEARHMRIAAARSRQDASAASTSAPVLAEGPVAGPSRLRGQPYSAPVPAPSRAHIPPLAAVSTLAITRTSSNTTPTASPSGVPTPMSSQVSTPSRAMATTAYQNASLQRVIVEAEGILAQANLSTGTRRISTGGPRRARKEAEQAAVLRLDKGKGRAAVKREPSEDLEDRPSTRQRAASGDSSSNPICIDIDAAPALTTATVPAIPAERNGTEAGASEPSASSAPRPSTSTTVITRSRRRYYVVWWSQSTERPRVYSFESYEPLVLTEVPLLLTLMGLDPEDEVYCWARNRSNWVTYRADRRHWPGIQDVFLFRRAQLNGYCQDIDVYISICEAPWRDFGGPSPAVVIPDLIHQL